MTELEATGVGEHPPPYIIFVVVFLFFITGLMGFLVCHLLKMKGYRCRAGDMDADEEEEEEEKLGGIADEEHEDNQDTVDQILKCIMENEANMEAFNEMLGNHNVCVRHDPRLRQESLGGVPPHHHTVHSGTEHNSCHLCAQGRSKKGRRPSRTPRSKQRPGEQTVFSVGRFRVTHTDKKLHGSPGQMVSSGDNLDQSQDSEEQKGGGYNLRSMFKDTRPASDTANGAVPNAGKRRKSVTLFGLRRGSDPVAIKVMDTGAMKLAVQKQPVVQEEEVQEENTVISTDKPAFKPEKPKHLIPGSVNPRPSQEKKESQDFSSGPEPGVDLTTGSSSAPRSLFISSPTEKVKHDAEKVSPDPGPLQTSTPIVAMTGSIPGFTLVHPSSQSESSSCTVFPVTQTPPDPDCSPDLDRGFGASLALISLGSSPQSSFPIKTPSSSSLLKTPSSSQAEFSPLNTPSPKLSFSQTVFNQTLCQTAAPVEGALSHSLHSNPKPDNIPDQRASPALAVKSGSKDDAASAPQASAPRSPVGGALKASVLSSPSDRQSSLCLSSCSPGSSSSSSSSSVGSRVSHVAIIKASPDSKREFSVVTMLEEEEEEEEEEQEEEEAWTSVKDQTAETHEVEKVNVDPAAGDMSQEKDDMVEMEDIRDCKVMQEEEEEEEEEDTTHPGLRGEDSRTIM